MNARIMESLSCLAWDHGVLGQVSEAGVFGHPDVVVARSGRIFFS